MLKKALLVFSFLLSPALFSGTPLKRDLLGLYNSRFDQMELNNLHKKLESAINHLGLKVTYVDVAEGIPSQLKSEERMERFLGVVTWHMDSKMARPVEYGNWLIRQVERGRKVIILGRFGFLADLKGRQTAPEFVNKVLKKTLGVKLLENHLANMLAMEPVFHVDRKLVEFERELKYELTPVDHVQSVSGQNRVWLSIKDSVSGNESDVVLISPNGGLAFGRYNLFSAPRATLDQEEITSWRINPFEFVKRALRRSSMPIGDVSTINGGRTFYTHIDGDAINNISYFGKRRPSGKVIQEEILSKRRLPHTVSFIVAELLPKYYGKKESVEIARKIAALPNVELASHAYTHPLVWNRNPTEEQVKDYWDYDNFDKDTGRWKKIITAYAIEGYDQISYSREIGESKKFIDKHVAPPKKKTEVFLWTGNCLPTEEAMIEIEKNGLFNMNGGDGRFDRAYNSYSHLSPLYRKVGRYYQIYTSNSNENLYTNLWKGPFGGFARVIETFENTERPFRIRPVNIYYHFYSGEHKAGLNALNKVFDWVEKRVITPVYASDYIRTVQGFISYRVERVEDGTFVVSSYGDMRTLRFDDEDNRSKEVDYFRSDNVVGHAYLYKSLYVFLGKGESARIVLEKKAPKAPYIVRSNGLIDSFEIKDKEMRIKGRSRVVSPLILVKGLDSGQRFSSGSRIFKVDKTGLLDIRLESSGEFDLILKKI